MNKIAIPAILAATVMIAGIFAFMPVEQATTVHTSGTITIANDAITAAKIATDALTSDELADSFVTEIGTLDRGWNWHVLDDTSGGAQDVILIPAVTDKDYSGRVVVSALDAIASRNCVVEDTGGDSIASTTDNTVETVQASFATGSGSLASGEGIRLDADRNVECVVTIFLETEDP
ncbi:MAG: hypothetical protein IIA83_09010 [Thaumarchaeota archaeon]|nr:hypothetical protein [Nitrososphaerota archaeon]